MLFKCWILILSCAAATLIDKTNWTWVAKAKPKPKPKPRVKPVNPPVNITGSRFTLVSDRLVNRYSGPEDSPDLFGYSLGISASSAWIAVGAPLASEEQGHVQLCHGLNSSICSRVSDPTPRGNHFEFGYALDISQGGDTFVTTAKTERRMFTSDWEYVMMQDIHIFVYGRSVNDDLGLTQTILVHSENEGLDTPVALSVYNDRFLVGLPWLSYNTFQGHAYIYERSSGTSPYRRVADLVEQPYDSEGDSAFGAAVELSAAYAFVGSAQASYNTGVVYTYSRDATTGAWALLQALLCPDDGFDNMTSRYFGYSLSAVNGTRLFVGAPGFGDSTGVVFRFDLSGGANGSFVFSMAVVASDGHSNDMFGFSLSCSSGGLLAAGAPGHTMYGQGSGAVYLFNANTGAEVQKYVESVTQDDDPDDGGNTGNAFGSTIAISGIATKPESFLLIGAGAAGTSDTGAGVVYIVDTTPFAVYDLSSASTFLGTLELIILSLVIVIPALTLLAYFVHRLRVKTPFTRVTSAGTPIELRLDIEEHDNGSWDEEDPTTENPIQDGLFYLNTPGSQSQNSPHALTPIHIPGKCSTHNPFRRVTSVSPINTPHHVSVAAAPTE